MFVVDRYGLMRHAAAEWIRQSSGLEVCGLAGDVTRALQGIARLAPDLVVSEIMRPSDLGFIRELRRRFPGLPILIFSMHEEAAYGARAREAGAHGYVMKARGGQELVRKVRALLRHLGAGLSPRGARLRTMRSGLSIRPSRIQRRPDGGARPGAVTSAHRGGAGRG